MSQPQRPQHATRVHLRRHLAMLAATCAFLAAPAVASAQEAAPRATATQETAHPAAAATANTLTPPSVIEAVEARYPSHALASGAEARVELRVVVAADGTVGAVEVLDSAGDAFDSAAVEAVRLWRFEPARRGGQAIDARIRVPFVFALPQVEEVATSTTTEPTLAEAPSNDDPIEVTVQGERHARTEERSAGDFRVERDVIAAAPRAEGADVLRSAPGLYVGRGEGPAVAHSYMLRGFDAEHGQDIAFHVAGIPINMPSHIHGQGYADLGFLIADTVQELSVSEGVYDPRQGDFAVAGSIDIALGVSDDRRGITLRSGYGSWNTYRQLVMWAPERAAEESFGAVQYMRTDGFGENRAGHSASGIVQHEFQAEHVTLRAVGIVYAARSDLAGVVRQDDVDAGRVCFECVYDYPTALAQNAQAHRFLSGLFASYDGLNGANGALGLWFGYDNFRSQTNNTGFIQQSQILERVAGRGDLIEQQNQTLSFGLTGRYRSQTFQPTTWASGTVEVGADGRLDVIDQTQNLLDASVRNQTWDRRVDASIRALDLGFWADLDWALTRYVRLRLGMRADVLSYDVEDRLGNFAPITRPQDSYIPGFRRSALGTAWGPRTSIEVHPVRWLTVLGAYGEGYRSPQARLLEDGEDAPFSKVRSADFGLRFDWGDPLRLTLGGYYTHLSDDVAYDVEEASLTRIGATRRLGAVASAVTRPTAWLVGSFSLTFVDALLLEPPPATASDPQPAFESGQNMPFVPPVVARADVGTRHTLVADAGGKALGARTGLGVSFVSGRPLPYGDVGSAVTLLDASAALTWGPLELTLEAFNLLNSEYAAVERSFASDWNPNDGVRPRTPEHHTAAGAPLSWMLSLGLTL